MSVDVFLDTNILVYAVTSDDREQAKRQRALEIIETEDFAISVRYQTSYWDGAILAAAESIGVPRLYSEDLNHGQRYGSVEVLNPFPH